MFHTTQNTPPPEAPAIVVGVSSCLLGHEVRYDTGHKRDRFITDVLSDYVTFEAICPEMGIGLGTPRETIHLKKMGDDVHLLGTKSGNDHTAAMRAYGEQSLATLKAKNIGGYIFKKDSPSCGLFRVRVYDDTGMPHRIGRGTFADYIATHMPYLPMEEEGRLNDDRLRENFIERLFAYQRIKALFAGDWRLGDLVNFHTREKMLLLAHDRGGYDKLGQLVARGKSMPPHALEAAYFQHYMETIAILATRKKHTDVLHHLAGYFKKHNTHAQRQELAGLIADYHAGYVPLVAPLVLIRHYIALYDVQYLADQQYLAPHPKELKLRNTL
jgi:uncharacterized protein YbgA (DUF1722 family)/uncharacterized protein YbbK (DUF523 family)